MIYLRNAPETLVGSFCSRRQSRPASKPQANKRCQASALQMQAPKLSRLQERLGYKKCTRVLRMTYEKRSLQTFLDDVSGVRHLWRLVCHYDHLPGHNALVPGW